MPDDCHLRVAGRRLLKAMAAHVLTRRAAGPGFADRSGVPRLSRIIWTNGGQNRSGSAQYVLHSRCHTRKQSIT
jgi:hypothetical protein